MPERVLHAFTTWVQQPHGDSVASSFGPTRGERMARQAKSTTGSMSEDHKTALAQGRSEGRAVRRYLEALEAHKPRRGRKRTVESMKSRDRKSVV